MPAKKPAAKSKKASKPVKTVVRKVTPAKKAAKPKPSAAARGRQACERKACGEKVSCCAQGSSCRPESSRRPSRLLQDACGQGARKAKAAGRCRKAKAVAPAPVKRRKAAAPHRLARQSKPEQRPAKAPTYVTAVAEKSRGQGPQSCRPCSIRTMPTTRSPSANLLAGPRNVQPYVAKRGEQYMGKEQLDHFRQILSNWKRDLMEEVDRTVHHMKDEAANFPDPNDRATQESEFSLELRTRDRERKLIRKIDEALKRIEDGSYGYCNETGEEIGVKRLEARPVATLSVEAQERRERREKQYGDRDDRYR